MAVIGHGARLAPLVGFTPSPFNRNVHSMHRFTVRSLTALAVMAALAACQELSSPDDDGVDESELTFIRVGANAPPLEADSIVFWAVRGETRMGEMRYVTPQYTGKCLLFRVPARSLLRHANGVPVMEGDSVRIVIRVEDEGRFQFSFEPSGLVFDPDFPAELEVRYTWADLDYNDDGQVNDRDKTDAERISFWHQAIPGAKWKKIPTSHLINAVEARAAVLGFSQYALAID